MAPNRLLIGSVVALTIAGTAGSAFAPALLTYSPLLLVALSPLPRHLVLVAPITSFAPFVLVALARGLISAAVAYWVGVSYGKSGLQWIEPRYPRLRKWVRWLERTFDRVGPVVVLVSPTSPVCALAGMIRMPAWQFLPAALLGKAAWAIGAYWLGDFLSEWTTPILHWVRENVVSATIACVAVFGGYQVIRRLRRKRRVDAAIDSLPKL